MKKVDTLIVNGEIVDGTGRPRYHSDVAIKNGVIVEIGQNLSRKVVAARTINAKGNIVTPGFVDVHTHYDGQITWDPTLGPSTEHGVTTVCFGNCGVGFSPCRKEDRQTLIDILEGVENIPGTALAEGMKWRWETFPEYMNFLSTLNCATDFAVMIGHVPIRLYVMGKDRCHDKPRKDDLVKMRKIVAEAVRAGALGISTSRTLLHRDLQGVVIPGSYAGRPELCALMSGLSDVRSSLVLIALHTPLEQKQHREEVDFSKF